MTRIEVDNSELRAAAKSGEPVEVVDRATGQAFYLISCEQYHQMCAALARDFDPREAYPAIEQVMADDDAHDPLLDSYQ